MLKAVFGLAVALFAMNSHAADQPEYAAPPPWFGPAPIPKRSSTDAGAAIQNLLEDIEDHFGSDGDQTYEEFAERVQTPQGLANIGNVVLNWRPDTAKALPEYRCEGRLLPGRAAAL